MPDLLSALAVVGVFCLTLAALAWLGKRARRRGVTVLSVFDEVYRPTAHDSHIEIRAHEERGIPTPSPSDP